MITTILSIVFAILGIILFFKIWGMTNDIREIKERLTEVLPTENEKKHFELQNSIKHQKEKDVAANSSFVIGETVRYAPMNRVMIVKSIHADGKVECVSYKKSGEEEFEGIYEPEQIEHFKQAESDPSQL